MNPSKPPRVPVKPITRPLQAAHRRRRDPVTELYEHCSSLLEATERIGECAGDPAAVPAIPAVLDCLAASFAALADGVQVLGANGLAMSARADEDPDDALPVMLERLGQLQRRLRDARRACDEARKAFACGLRDRR